MAQVQLDEEIDELRDLDIVRVRAAALRDWGYECLDRWICDNPKLTTESLVDEGALIVRVLLRRTSEPSDTGVATAVKSWTEKRIAELEGLRLEDLMRSHFETVRAAQVAQALTAAPNSTFSESVLYCYYLIVRELFTTDAPDWCIGGARMGRNGLASAFATGECIRALRGFILAQENTARLVRDLGAIRQQRRRLEHEVIPQDWRIAEVERASLSFYTTLRIASTNLTVLMKVGDAAAAAEYIDQAPKRLYDDILSAHARFKTTAETIERYRRKEKDDASGNKEMARRLERSEYGHLVALKAVRQAEENARQALTLFDPADLSAFDRWADLESGFRAAADQVRTVLRSAVRFVTNVLDREVATALGGRQYDASELACAASAYGTGCLRWDDDRLAIAAAELVKAVSDEGRLPPGKPVHVDTNGNAQTLYSGASLRALARLLQNVETVPVPPPVASKMLRFFENTSVQAGKQFKYGGWLVEWAGPYGWSVGTTASAVQALDRLNRMLDRRINQAVLRHFSVKYPRSTRSDLNLDNVFYPDYGLRLAPARIRRQESVAILLQRMRLHVAGVRLPRPASGTGSDATGPTLGSGHREPLHSIVLHGPPGTGKTSLLEALANTCDVPLVEVTPSDIVIRGEDSIERRTRAVFTALSMLTRVVIMLDEFDPVLWRRDPADPSPRTVFSFLTPGMLPKLKELDRQAKRRRFAYGLITNLVGGLEPAAIREGRFDSHVGIYPPDPLSRAGRFLSELLASAEPLPEGFKLNGLRTHNVVTKTARIGMALLGRRGWYVAAKRPLQSGTPFVYVLDNGPEPEWPESDDGPIEVQGSGRLAILENKQWQWIEKWDGLISVNANLSAGLAAAPQEEPVEKWPNSSAT